MFDLPLVVDEVTRQPIGYRWSDIVAILSCPRTEEFEKFMRGQTVGVGSCGEYLVYPQDLKRFFLWGGNSPRGY